MTSTRTQEKIEATRAMLATSVKALQASDEWRRMLDYMASFHHYSLTNILLIKAQRPDATQVAGFRQWTDKGRQVRKGEHGMRIFGYRSHVVTVDDENHIIKHPKPGEGTRRTVTWFPIVTVFDVAQTDPIEGRETFEKPKPITGRDRANIIPTLTRWLEEQGWTVGYETITGGVDGYTTTDGTHRIAIRNNDAPAHQAITLLHETAHMILHTNGAPGEYVQHRGMKETEAESSAYVVAKIMGIETGAESIHYVAGWAQSEPDALEKSAENVRTAAARILEALNIQ